VSSSNAYGNAKKNYALPLENVRCRLIEDRERVFGTETQESAIHTVYRLMVKGDVDVTERAKISSVTLEDGTVISDVFEVTELLTRRGRNSHHKTATLERIS
jgi:hypothetical protein